jgi:hypothetical protein
MHIEKWLQAKSIQTTVYQISEHLFYFLAIFLTRFTKTLSGRAWRLKFRPDEFSKDFTTEKWDACRPQTDQLIELYLSKSLEEHDTVEGTRFKTKILIETALTGRGNNVARNDKLRLF